MELNQDEVRSGLLWFFCMGVVAVSLSFILMRVDDYLTYSPHERNLGATLRELRGAQTKLGGRVSDERLYGAKSEERPSEAVPVSH